MKKVLFSLFFILCALFIFSAVKVSATDTGVVTITNGASVRTENPSGLRFEATVSGEFEGSSISYGFVLTRGTFTKDQVLALAENKKVEVDCGEPDGEGKYNVTITNIPEEGYTGPVTALAYVKVDGVNRYSSAAVTRNIAGIAMQEINFNRSSDFINDICSYADSIYMLAGWGQNNSYNLYDSIYDHDYVTLGKQFLADWNTVFGTNLASFGASSFYASAKPVGATYNNANSSNKDLSDSNLYRFFNHEKYGVKWSWLLDYFITIGTSQSDTHTLRQANAIKGNGTNGDYVLYGANHIIATIVGFFTKTRLSIFHWGLDFSGDSPYTTLASLDKVTCRANDYDYYMVGDTLVLPAELAKDYYSWQGYTDSKSNILAAESNYTITSSEDVFTPTFTPITYNINYHLDDGSNGVGNPATYNVETATINLADASKAGYVFAGWYGNGSFTGDQITSIAHGSHGDKDLYAKFIREVSYVNPAWAGTTPGQTVNYDDHDYTFGTDAFATIKAAVEAASVGEQIYVLAGTYSDAFTITKDYVSLIGPNNNVAGNSNSRVSPATITGQITLAKAVAHISICGFDFTGNAKIINTIGDATEDTVNVNKNVNGFEFSYNKVQSGLTTGDGFIYFVEAKNCYSHDLVFTNNYFAHANGGATTAMVYLNNLRNLNFDSNVVKDVNGHGLYVNDKTKGASGESLLVKHNTFDNISGNAVHFNWVSYLPAVANVAVIEVNDNSFNDVRGVGVVIGPCNNSDAYLHVQVNANEFTGNVYLPILIDRVTKASVYFATGNAFYCTLSSVTITLNSKTVTYTNKYVANGMHATTNYTIDATNNTYPSAPTNDNFTSNVTH